MGAAKEALREQVAALTEEVRALRAELAARPHHCHSAPIGWYWCTACNTLAWPGAHLCMVTIPAAPVAVPPYVITYESPVTFSNGANPGLQSSPMTGTEHPADGTWSPSISN